MTELDHKKFPGPPKIVKREVAVDETEKYISDNWNLLENNEKETFKKLLSKAFDYVLNKIDVRKTNGQ